MCRPGCFEPIQIRPAHHTSNRGAKKNPRISRKRIRVLRRETRNRMNAGDKFRKETDRDDALALLAPDNVTMLGGFGRNKTRILQESLGKPRFGMCFSFIPLPPVLRDGSGDGLPVPLTKPTILNGEVVECCEERSQSPRWAAKPIRQPQRETTPRIGFCYDGRSGHPVGTAGT
jgi:hypothetical protein